MFLRSVGYNIYVFSFQDSPTYLFGLATSGEGLRKKLYVLVVGLFFWFVRSWFAFRSGIVGSGLWVEPCRRLLFRSLLLGCVMLELFGIVIQLRLF